MKYYYLTLLWVLWCFFHSLLITPLVTDFLKRKLLSSYKYFRLFYNVFALATFIAISRYASTLPKELLYKPDGYLLILQLLIFIISILLFVVGTKNYDIKQFLGITQLSDSDLSGGIGKSGEFNQSGILQYTRHPWYLGIILILWSGFYTLDMSRMIMNSVFTLYVIVGTILEEKKLVAEFGNTYRKYQKKVPMFISYKSFRK